MDNPFADFIPDPQDAFLARIASQEDPTQNPLAVSPAGAKGRMQVMDATNLNPGFGVVPARDNSEAERTRVGQDYARALLGHYGDERLAAAAYNAGPGRVNQWIQQFGDPRSGQVSWDTFLHQIPLAETRGYVATVAPKQQPSFADRAGNLLGSMLVSPAEAADPQHVDNPFASLIPQKAGAAQPAPQAVATNPFADLIPPKKQGPDTGFVGAATEGLESGLHGLVQSAETAAQHAPALNGVLEWLAGAPKAMMGTGAAALRKADIGLPVEHQVTQWASHLLGQAGGTEAQPQPSVASEPITGDDLAHPVRLGEKAVYGLTSAAPTLIGGGPLGAGIAGAVQSLGPYYQAEIAATPNDPSGAYKRALEKAATSGVFTAGAWKAFEFMPFNGAVKNALFQAFGVQPAIAMGQKAATNVLEGKKPDEDVGTEYLPGAVGTLVPFAGHAILHGLAKAASAATGAPGEQAASAPASQPSGAGTNGAVPPVSETPGFEKLFPPKKGFVPLTSDTGAHIGWRNPKTGETLPLANSVPDQAKTGPESPSVGQNRPEPSESAPTGEGAVRSDGFVTAKGSVYLAHEDGTTTRLKAYRPEHGDDYGLQPRSEATFYVTPEQADALSLFQTEGPQKAIQPTANGAWGVRYLAGKDTGKFERRTLVQPSTVPQEGLIPVELWNNGSRVHFGNEITRVSQAATPAEGTPSAPVKVETPDDLTRAEQRVDQDATPAQVEAGNARKGHIDFQGFPVTIETPKGSQRTGVNTETGEAWQSPPMPAAYGYLKRTAGADGDQIDAYIGDDPKSPHVFVIDQVNPDTKAFDESKVMLGFPSKSHAFAAYHAAFNDGRGEARIGSVVSTNREGLLDFLNQADHSQPASEWYATSIPEDAADGGAGRTSTKGYPLDADTLTHEALDILDIPRELPRGDIDTLSQKVSADTRAGDAQLFGDVANADAIRAKGFGSLDVERQRMVQRQMLAAIHDPQVLDAVVKLAPIDVVHNLGLGEGTPDGVFHDHAVLFDRLSAALNDTVGKGGAQFVDAIAARLPLSLALHAAKEIGLSSRETSDGQAAVRAGDVDHPQSDTKTAEGEQPKRPPRKPKASDEFKVGDVLDPQGNTNMRGKVTVTSVEGNTLKFRDEEGTDYSGMARATVRDLIKGGSWKRVASEEPPKPPTPPVTDEGEGEPVAKPPRKPRAPSAEPEAPKRPRLPKLQDVGEVMAGKRAQAKADLDKQTGDKGLENLLDQTRAAADFREVLDPEATTGAHVYADAVRRAFKPFLEAEGANAGAGRRKWQDNFSESVAKRWEKAPDAVRENASRYIAAMDTLRDVLSGAKNVAEINKALHDALHDGEATGYHNARHNDLYKDLSGYARHYMWERGLAADAVGIDKWSGFRDEAKMPTRATPLIRPGLPVEHIERTGFAPRRPEGVNVSPDHFRDVFGFRGVEFGNWVSGGEGQTHLNAAYDALHDFAETLGIPARAISFGGRLGLAFGSRGRGRHAAHFEPGNDVINLTKTKGDGSVAHEWGHALDYALRKTKGGDSLLRIVNNALRHTWATPKEALDRLDRILRGETFIANNKSLGAVKTAQQYVESLWRHWDRRGTNFHREAVSLGKDYWAKPEELLARSFESWVHDRMAEQEHDSPYLVNDWVAEGKVNKEAGYRGAPYPTGEERQNFAHVWSEVLKYLKWTEDGKPEVDTIPNIPTGANAIEEALSKVDIPKRWAELKKEHENAGKPGPVYGTGEEAPSGEPSEGEPDATGEGGISGSGDESGDVDSGVREPAGGHGPAKGGRDESAGGKPAKGGEEDSGVGSTPGVSAEGRGDGDADRAERGVRGQGYRVAEDGEQPDYSRSPAQRATDNIAAIKLVKALEAEGRLASPEEQSALAKFVGWGGLPQIFDEANAKFAKAREELKAELTPEQYEAARLSTLNAHYTSPDVVRGVWDALGDLKFNGDGTVLEDVLPAHANRALRVRAQTASGVRPEPRGYPVRLADDIIAHLPDSVTPEEQKLIDSVNALAEKIAPGATVRAARSIKLGDRARGQSGAWTGESTGLSIADGARHTIAWALSSPDARGTVRHETLHYLRAAGLITDPEWAAMAKESDDRNWQEKHDIDARYPGASPDIRTEESIASEIEGWRSAPAMVPDRFKPMWERISRFLAQVADHVRRVFGRDATASDVFSRILSGEVGARGVPVRHEPVGDIRAQMPDKKKIGQMVDRHMPEAAARVFDLVHDVENLVAPMATGSATARATTKDFANLMRLARWQGQQAMDGLRKQFKRDQLERMWTAADKESVALQRGQNEPPADGLASLSAPERRAVQEQQADADSVFHAAQSLGMVKAEGLPSYVPRMVVEMADAGAKRLGSDPSARSLPGLGRTMRTTTPNLLKRKYLTTEETEAAASAKFDTDAVVVKDIRTLPLATMKLREALAGRALINAIKKIGQHTGEMLVSEGFKPERSNTGHGWFTIDHPSFYSWQPKFTEVDGKFVPVKDQNGEIVFEKQPIYVRSDFEGPLRAVLREPSGATYNALMNLKSKAMVAIMYSPLIHNAVEWGRALPAMPGKVATFRIYFEGNAAKHDPDTMHEAIMHGLVPIGHRAAGIQDVTGIQNLDDLRAGRSLTAKIAGFVPGLFDAGAKQAVYRAIDKAGDVWHNKLLWDRVGDLQMGLYTNFRDYLVRKKGITPDSAQYLAAHLANRYAGALPIEAMSAQAQKLANILMFSRTYTLGNLGAMKDVITGLPRDVQAQIERAGGVDELMKVKSIAKRKARVIQATDIALFYLGNSILQSAVAYLTGRKDLDKIEEEYVGRLLNEMVRVTNNPLELLHPFDMASRLSATSDNEPDRDTGEPRQRILVGYDHDGTAIYARNPTGKIGEEFAGWMLHPLSMVERKLAPMARATWDVVRNQDSFGHRIYDPHPKGYSGMAMNLGKVFAHYLATEVPISSLQAGANVVTGKGQTMDYARVAGPLVGVTFSRGAPGGPETGLYMTARTEHDQSIRESLPGIIQQVKEGDRAGAVKKMIELHMDQGFQRWVLQHATAPRLTGRERHKFYGEFATQEQAAQMRRLEAQQPTQ